MPLTEIEKSNIRKDLKLEPTLENLGTILRRACAFAPKSLEAWEPRLDLIEGTLIELQKLKPEEIIKENKEGKTALQYAIHNLLTYASESDNEYEIFFRLQLIKLVASYSPITSLNLKDFINTYRTDIYKKDPEQLYDTVFKQGVKALPTVEICIKAIDHILTIVRNCLISIESANIKMKELNLYDKVETVNPIIILSDHRDVAVPLFF